MLEREDTTTVGVLRCCSSPCEYNSDFKIDVGAPRWIYKRGCEE